MLYLKHQTNKKTEKMENLTNLEETFLKATKALVEEGLTVEEAKKEVKAVMNIIANYKGNK